MVDRNLIIERLREEEPDSNDNFLNLEVDELFNNYVEELEPNLIEWINHKPLSDIYIGELSINILTKEWGVLDMVDSFVRLKAYKDGGCKDAYWTIHRRLIM
ncbi:MAG: hypothetical protein IJ716_06030 [Lachnospiraceae bacterium]|nr:hypothetical protein [Lachnospiraceae bacterium]